MFFSFLLKGAALNTQAEAKIHMNNSLDLIADFFPEDYNYLTKAGFKFLFRPSRALNTSCCLLEWFSFECRKTKTKVITLANHKEHRQYSEPIKIRSNYM